MVQLWVVEVGTGEITLLQKKKGEEEEEEEAAFKLIVEADYSKPYNT